MSKISLNYIVELQEQWKRTYSPDEANIYIEISREVMHKIKHNNNELPNPLHISLDYKFDNYAPIYYTVRQIAQTDILSIEKDDENDNTIVVMLKE